MAACGVKYPRPCPPWASLVIVVSALALAGVIPFLVVLLILSQDEAPNCREE
jgi:hypothetical protein